jgi:hypothetical protein
MNRGRRWSISSSSCKLTIIRGLPKVVLTNGELSRLFYSNLLLPSSPAGLVSLSCSLVVTGNRILSCSLCSCEYSQVLTYSFVRTVKFLHYSPVEFEIVTEESDVRGPRAADFVLAHSVTQKVTQHR